MVAKCWFWLVLGFAMSLERAIGQAVPEPIDDERLVNRIEAACEVLRTADRLVRCEVLSAAADNGAPVPRPAAPRRTERLDPEVLRDLLWPSLRIVGHYYLCTECDRWHFSGASGFCVDADGDVATCAHVLETDATMREAYLVVADLGGHVEPVEGVLVADRGADLCVLRTPARGTVPLPVRTDPRVGERLYCLSNPDHHFGYFSEGLLARTYLERDPDAAPEAAPRPWLHVTCDFAQGSSGGMVVDARGNLVGIAQSTTTVVYEDDDEVADTQMVFRSAVPASVLRRLVPAGAPKTAEAPVAAPVGADPAGGGGGRPR